MWRKSGSADVDRRLVRILEVDPDLAADLAPDAVESAATELIAPVASLEWQRHRGRWGPSDPRGTSACWSSEAFCFARCGC